MALKSIPCDLTIILGPKALGAFVDSECSTPITSLHWGEVKRGSSASFDMYLKNTGVEAIKVGARVPEDISAWGSVTMAPAAVSLAASEVQKVTIKMSILPGATLGAQSCTLELVEVP